MHFVVYIICDIVCNICGTNRWRLYFLRSRVIKKDNAKVSVSSYYISKTCEISAKLPQEFFF